MQRAPEGKRVTASDGLPAGFGVRRAASRYWAAVAILFTIGLRISEVLGLSWEDIDLPPCQGFGSSVPRRKAKLHVTRYRNRRAPVDMVRYLVPDWSAAMAITASEARKNLFPLIEQVNNDRTPIEITSKRGDAVLIAIDDYRALEETAHLLRSPVNVRRLLESLDQARSGNTREHELDR